MELRIGQGYDVHRLVEGGKCILGGVEIPHDKGLLGYSDADVLCHAIADALLGAGALGDIGVHFPDTDKRYADISSILLLEKVRDTLEAARFTVLNVDATLIAERPKVSAYVRKMRENISSALGVTVERISVKATTSEGLGFTGRGEGIAALAVALIERKNK